MVDRRARRPLTQQKFAALAREMYDDPELTGDVLTFALALAELLTRPNIPSDGKGWPAMITEHVGARYKDWTRAAIRQDLPRHQPNDARSGVCIGQMIRRPGACEKPSTQRHWLRDPLNGEVFVVGSCARHHDEVGAAEQRDRLAWIAAGSRPGPQNAGGVLERYFAANWEKIYAWSSPSWTRPGSPLEPPRRPTLVLIHGGLELAGER